MAEAPGNNGSSLQSIDAFAVDGETKLLDDYKLGEIIGQGAFGVVHACTSKKDPSDKQELCVKMIDKVESPLAAIKRETDMLQRLDHFNVVKLRSVYWEDCFVCVVMDRFMGGDLIQGMQLHWKNRGKIPVGKIGPICRQIVASIHYLHGRNIVHRDIKGDNYLMDRPAITDMECRIVVADFGTAKELQQGERMSSSCGTKAYWPPEFFRKDYGVKVDVWAIGILIYGMAHSRFPFKGERDACQKDPRLAPELPANFVDLLKRLLEKSEQKRASAAEAAVHSFIVEATTPQTAMVATESVEITPLSEADKKEVDALQAAAGEDTGLMREGGANEAIADRRQELIDMLQCAMERQNTSKSSALPLSHLYQDSFDVLTTRAPRATKHYQWQPAGEGCGVLPAGGASSSSKSLVTTIQAELFGDRGAVSHHNGSEGIQEVVGHILREHGVDVTGFGKGTSKTLTAFAAEVQTGASRLMLDAREHKKIVRVVDVVLLRLSYSVGKSATRYLIETSEKYSDGRPGHSNRLPGMKKDPHMNTRQVAEKLLKERLNMDECKVSFDVENHEAYEEEEESSSYPGVKTIYYKEIVEGHLVTDNTGLLGRLGLKSEAGKWQYEDASGTTRSFTWATELDCDTLKVRLKAPLHVSDMAYFVRAPVGFTEEDLQKHLESHHVDISGFGKDGAKTLKQFSGELLRGESCLIEMPIEDRAGDHGGDSKGGAPQGTADSPGGTVDRKSRLVRCVDVVLLLLYRPDTGYLLVEMKEETPGEGNKPRLPGTKRRPDENQYLAAKRYLKKILRIDENFLDFRQGKDGVSIIEEEKDSPSFPGIRTLYRKCVLTADIVRPQDDSVEGQLSDCEPWTANWMARHIMASLCCVPPGHERDNRRARELNMSTAPAPVAE